MMLQEIHRRAGSLALPLAALLLASLAGSTPAQAEATARSLEAPAVEAAAGEAPAVVAVKFHADWCGSCRAMGPAFEDLANKHDGAPVLFVELDQTNQTRARQASLLATALGLGPAWTENRGKTGFILLLDGRTKQVLDRLTAERTLKEMSAALEAAVAQARR
jgi:thiol-disulfide isomerase/thioredoxin